MFPNDNSSKPEEGITISKRQASILVALFLLLALTVFIIGYFLGKRTTLDSIASSFEQEIEKVDQVGVGESELENTPDVSAVNQDFAFDKSEAVTAQAVQPEEVVVEEKPTAPIKAYAQLIGFGSKKSASAFKERLAKKNIDVIIKTRSSRTAKGKKRYWYQAITPVFTSLDELESTVKKIQKLEFIRTKDINIVHIKEQED